MELKNRWFVEHLLNVFSPKAAIVADWRKATCKILSFGMHNRKGINLMIFFQVLLCQLFHLPAASDEAACAFSQCAEWPTSLTLTIMLLIRALTSSTCIKEICPAAIRSSGLFKLEVIRNVAEHRGISENVMQAGNSCSKFLMGSSF